MPPNILSPFWLSILIPTALASLFVLWWMLGPGPHRARRLRKVRKFLQQGDWSKALEHLRGKGRPSGRWKRRFDEAEAECLQTAVNQALKEKNFDLALERALAMVQLQGRTEAAAQAEIQTAMLEEMRRLFSTGTARAVLELAAQPLMESNRGPSFWQNRPAIRHQSGIMLLASSPEASFWVSLCHLREGQMDKAVEGLQALCEPHGRRGEGEKGRKGEEDYALTGASSPSPPLPFSPSPLLPTTRHSPLATFLDPPLYLGALLLRRGQTKEAVRLLTEANRIDNSCPIVTLLLGSAMIAAGGDASMATRALKKALGPSGLARWVGNPSRAWAEAFPEHHSYVRRLAEKHPFICPIWGGDLNLLTRQGHLALAQGLFRLGQFQEASDLFNEVLKEGAPSPLVLRGLGISLARLGKYDDAFKHLRIAHEMEEPKDRLTAGYLALCGALGKPSKPEDKVQNVVWAIRLVTQFNAPRDNEWIALVSDLFAEARAQNVPLTLDDQLYLCEHLWSVEAADPRAAQSYQHLQATFPQAVRPEYAWLYCRAVGRAEPREGPDSACNPAPHGARLASPLLLFALTFAHEAEARAFFSERKWDFGEVELLYLTRAAELEPGRFPTSLGPDYLARGEALLLARSLEQEKAGQLPAALGTAEILERLAPHNSRALDRLAYLHYRLGQSDRALAVLSRWQESHPLDPIPLMRQAVFLYQNQQSEEGQAKIRQALGCSQGRQRADAAFLGARLALFYGREETKDEGGRRKEEENRLDSSFILHPSSFLPSAHATAQDFLQECLQNWPGHVRALECLAAVRWLRGDLTLLAAQADSMCGVETADRRFDYLTALCHWAGHDAAATIQRLNGCQADPVKQEGPESVAAPLAQLVAAPSDKGSPKALLATHHPPPAAGLNLDLESSFLEGLAYCRLEDWAHAQTALEPVAQSGDSPSAPLAQAFLGAVCFAQEKYAEAEHWWQKLDAKKRAGWQLAGPLAGTALLSALAAMEAGKFEEAAERFRTAGKLGCRDRRLGPLLIVALFRAGQGSYYGAG